MNNTGPIMQLYIEYGTAVVHSEEQYKPHPFPFYKTNVKLQLDQIIGMRSALSSLHMTSE